MGKTKQKKYRAPDGTVYNSYKEYVNSPDLDSDIIQSKLWTGERKPQNASERELLREIQNAKKKGTCLEYYPE